MSSYGELIQALRVLKNVKEKRHGIKTLASLCANRAFQVRIVQRGGWRTAILPLIISLDEDCRMYAALAAANLSTSTAAHPQLLEEEVLRHLVPILQSEEVQEVIAYVLNALGNFACSNIMWQQLQQMNTVDGIVTILKQTQREEIRINCLFALANLTADPWHRKWMMGKEVYEIVWGYMQDPNYTIMSYSLAILRGLAVEPEAQELFPSMGLVPLLIGIFHSQCPQTLKTLTMDLLLHFSMLKKNAGLMMEKEVVQVIELAGRGTGHIEYVPSGIAIIANLCESVDLHDRIVESSLFEVLTEHIHNDNTTVQQHVVRALMQLSLSPKYHHVILSTGAMANVCPIAMTERLSIEMRTNALQMMAAVCATHPTTPTGSDIIDLMFLLCNVSENMDIRRAAALVIANASADKGNLVNLLHKPYMEALSIAVSKSQDSVLVDYLMQFFHNLVKLDHKAGNMLMACGFSRHLFNYERLESLSVTAAIYLCDTCRQLANDAVVRSTMLEEMLFSVLTDAWVVYIEDPRLAPHLALMCSAFCYHTDAHQEFVLQGGVRLLIQLYSKSKVEHVRLCSLLSLLYLAETGHSQRAIAQEKGIQVLLTACENETHIDLIVNALKALIPFASSDDFRPQLGMEGGLDTFSSFLFSDQLQLQQLGIYLLQNLLEFRENRRIFLDLAEEKKCEEDYLETLIRFLPKVVTGQPRKIKAMQKKKGAKDKDPDGPEATLTPHDPFIVRSCIHSVALLSLEHNLPSFQRFINLGLPKLLFDLFYSEQIDKSSGEAIVLFFANLLHSNKQIMTQVMKGADIVQLLLSPRDMLFAPHTIARCLSALLCIARVSDFKKTVIAQLDLLMADLNANLNSELRDENFYQITSLHCALLSELARASYEHHERMAKAGVVEALLVFITISGKGLNKEVCIELIMAAVFGIAALVGSPTSGEHCMASLIFPATRMQLLLSLLRLPQEDINQAFHSGTVGLRTLQRVVYPDITAEELHVDHMDRLLFLGNCHVRPADFIYRNVIRTMCLLLAHPEMGPRVQQAMAPSNVVPTCLFAMKGCDDVYVQVYGFLLVSNFSRDRSLLHAFLNESAVINELLTTVRRSSPQGNPTEAPVSVPDTLASGGKGGTGPWSSQAVALNRYMLAMAALTNFAERVKEKFRGEDGEIPVDPDMKDDGGLVISNRITLNKLTSSCMKVLDCEDIEKKQVISDVAEFTALLRVLIMANTFHAKVELEDPGRGGEVKMESIDATHIKLLDNKRDLSGIQMVLQPLRHDYRNLGQVSAKCAGMLQVVKLCIGLNQAPSLIASMIECLTGLTFLSPLSLRTPVQAYEITEFCPEWLQSSLYGLIANSLADPARIGQFEEESDDSLAKQHSDHLFPLLSTSTLEIRQKVLGMLANIATQNELLEFIRASGVFRIIKAIPGKGFFVEHFALMIEITRMLTNMTCRPNTHTTVMTSDTMAFLRDVLRHTALLLHAIDPSKEGSKDEDTFDYYDVTFEEDDAPPLGLRIRWELPPQLSEVLPDTPAARVGGELRPGDELVDVNGVDVTELEQADIAPMFEARPLKLLFRRRPELKDDLDEGAMRTVGNIRVEEVKKVSAYGDTAQYLECFNLAVLVIHNLAVQSKNLKLLHSEPRILSVLLDVMPADSTSPSLRRLLFSALTCLCQERVVAGRIFYAMADYFQNCNKPDGSLQKYIMCCANLFYTSMSREEVQPDRGMLMFVSRISATEDALASRRALIEILHGMSQAPKELRRKFLSREILVMAVKYMETHDSFDVQIRAFESIYFLTISACAPTLWADLELLPIMVRCAGFKKNMAEDAYTDMELYKHADALWEIALRSLDECLKYDVLVQQMKIPDLDRYLMDLLIDSRKPASMTKVAADLMAGMLQSSIAGIVWTRWRALGAGEKLVGWFKIHKDELLKPVSPKAAELNESSPSDSLDAMLHMLLFAVEVDSSMVVALVAEDVLTCIANRILELAQRYEEWNEASGGRRLSEDLEEERNWFSADATAAPFQGGSEGVDRPSADEVAKADSSFRIIAQLLTALVANEHGLRAMSALNLEVPLVSLLEIPSAAFRVPVMLVLCALSSNKSSCEKLMKSKPFLSVLRRTQSKLTTPGEAPPMKDEVEYLMCILDRTCCHPDLALTAQEQLFKMLCVLPSKAETMTARLMALRALSRCAFVNPQCMNEFAIEGVACLQYVMAINSCLNMGSAEDSSQKVASRRRLIMDVTESLAANPNLAPLVEHFSRAILCEAVSVSRGSCNATFDQLNMQGMLEDVKNSFHDTVDKLEGYDAKPDVIAAELMNKLVSMLHITLCSVFRHGRPAHTYDKKNEDELEEMSNGGFKAAEAKSVADGLVRVLDEVHSILYLGFEQVDRDDPMSKLADMLTSDIRVLFYLTALLREVAAKPLRSPFLGVTRSKAFFEALGACIRLALKRLSRETKGPPPRDLFANKLRGGPGETPLALHMQDFDLALIFEHIIVCLRHTLTQAMYVTPEVSTKPLPWAWISQERLPMHQEAMSWLPQIVKRYKNTPAIRTETLRYFSAAASFESAPKARPQDVSVVKPVDDDEEEQKKARKPFERDSTAASRPPLPPPAAAPPATTAVSPSAAGASKVPTSSAEGAAPAPARPPAATSPSAKFSGGASPPTSTAPPVARVSGKPLPQVSVSMEPKLKASHTQLTATLAAAPTPKAAVSTTSFDMTATLEPAEPPIEEEQDEEVLDIAPATAPEASADPAEEGDPEAHTEDDAVEPVIVMSTMPEVPEGLRLPLGGLISLRQVDLRTFLADELEKSEDMYTLCLAMLTVANFTGSERERIAFMKERRAKLEEELPLADITRLMNGMVKVMQRVPKLEDWDIGNVMTLHGMRFLTNLIAFEHEDITGEMHRTDVLATIKHLYEFWFWDENRIADPKLFVQTLQTFVRVLRNWCCGSSLAEIAAKQRLARRDKDTMEADKSLVKIFKKGIDVPDLIHFTMKVVKGLMECSRKIPNKEEEIDKVIVDTLVIFSTLLKRTDDQQSMDWTKLDVPAYEQFLVQIKVYRYKRAQTFEDGQILNTLYLMVKQGFPFKGLHFLEFLMEVAYGDHREEHTTLQDMAAVCCAIISTQNAKDVSAPTVNVANVVKDNAAFIHSLLKVPDPKMQIWHYRLITGWSRRPKVLDDLAGDPTALQHVIQFLLNTNLCRYSAIIVHNMSMLRSSAIMSKGDHLVTICECYRLLGPGATLHRGDDAQRRLVRRLLLASVRNCLWNAQDIDEDLSEADLQAIIDLVHCVELADVPFYMAMLLHASEGCNLKRIRLIMPANKRLVLLLVQSMADQVTACNVDLSQEPVFESGMYALITEDEAKKADEYDTMIEQRDIVSKAPKKQSAAYKKLLATPGSPATRGLGVMPSLYQRSRRRGGVHPAAAASSAGQVGSSAGAGGGVSFSSVEERRGQQEFLYFAAVELMTFCTFTTQDERPKPLASESPTRPAVKEAFDDAFATVSLEDFLRKLQEQVEDHKGLKVVLSDMFVHVTAKFIWHCWSHEIFREHIDQPQNLEILAEIVPFLLGWPNQDVQTMTSDICLYAGLHRFPDVCEFLAKEYHQFPELTCALLTRCMISPAEETGLKPKQAVGFVKVFVKLLRERRLSHSSLLRLAIGLERCLLMDSPKGICGILAQREFDLLGDLLEALSGFSESATVKQSTVCALTTTAGKYYKAMPELDNFMLRVLDMAVPLLDAEFTLFMPVLYRLAAEGGRRVQGPMLTRQLHLRVARLLEQAVGGVEADQHKIAGYDDEDEAPPPMMGPRLGNRERMQWCLAFLTALATVQVHQSDEQGGEAATIERSQDIHFDSFVCVDLLPLLVRILRQKPGAFESLAVCFLLSSVSTSPCLPPHLPDFYRIAEKAFPALLGAADPAKAATELEEGEGLATGVAGPSWGHLRVPPVVRMEAGIRRCFVHLLSRSAHEPLGNASVLNSQVTWRFLLGLKADADLYGDPGAAIHAKLYALSNLLNRAEDHGLMVDLGVLEALLQAKDQIDAELFARQEEPDFPDLRLPWVHCVISLVRFSGSKLIVGRRGEEFEQLISFALDFVTDLQCDLPEKIQHGTRGLAMDLECQQALGASLAPLSAKQPQFGMLRPKYTLYLLSLICSAPLLSLRTAASDYLLEMLENGHEPEYAGAAFLKTNCIEAFRRIVTGSLDELAASTGKMMIALASSCYDVHVHLLDIMDTVIAQVGNPTSGPSRVIALSEFFVALTQPRTAEVLNGLMELETVIPFLGLARSNVAQRRALVQKWLENFGSSLYELDEVSEVFQGSTLQGILHVCARSTLDVDEAEELRRVVFGLVYRRVETWRGSYFGPYEFLSEKIIAALIPMCELQPDLVAALCALFHSFITKGETRLMERLWTGDHMSWLCKRMAGKSRAQLVLMKHTFETTGAGAVAARTGVPPPKDAIGAVSDTQLKKGWERHVDLVATHGMVLRLVSRVYDLFAAEMGAKLTKDECVVKNWRDHVTFYCHHVQWPLREDRKLESVTEAVISLEMRIAHRLVGDVNEDLQKKLVQQGMIGLCSTVLLPTPEQQSEFREAIGQEDSGQDTSETKHLPDAKMLAGNVISMLLSLQESYKYIQDRRAAGDSVAMFSQLHHWREAVFEQQGSVAVLSSVTLMERQATLYLAMLSCQTIDWCFENMGLAHMDVFCSIFLKLWGLHPNVVLKHHALRLVSAFCQVATLYASLVQSTSNAELVSDAIHRTFGIWDVRELRHIMRLVIASLCHALNVPTTSELFSTLVARSLQRKADCAKLVEVLRNGATARSSMNASKHILKATHLSQVLSWCEKSGDMYGRTWSLWLVLTFLAYEIDKKATATLEEHGPLDSDLVIVIQEESLEEVQAARRNRLRDAQEAASGVAVDRAAEERSKADATRCRIHWIRGSSQLVRGLALAAGKCISYQWKESQQIGCVASAWCLVEMHSFVQTAVTSIDGKALCKCFTLPEKSLQIASMMLVTVVSSIRLPLNAQNIAGEFLQNFHNLQQTLIESLAAGGEGPYDMIARWLHEPPMGLPCEFEFRCLVSYMLGQCMCPPLAATPSLDLDSAIAAPGRGLVSYSSEPPPATPSKERNAASFDDEDAAVTAWEIPPGAPPVAECGAPPQALLDKLAEEVIKEDLRLRGLQTPKGEGPVFSTMLCHLLYSLAVMVPHHPKAAAQSAAVRGAAFTQLMKVQQIVAQNIQPKALYDPADGNRDKLFLYIRATACIRSALQTIMASWFAADFGARFVVTEEGGKDFMQYCTKHINQVYNSKTALTRVMGSPWERVMLSQGPTKTIAELLIVVCSADANLVEVSKLGGEQALHSLSRYGDTAQVRQQATMLLTKLAVMLKT